MLQFKDENERMAWDQYAASSLQAVVAKWESQAARMQGRPMGPVRDDAAAIAAAVDLADKLLEERRRRK